MYLLPLLLLLASSVDAFVVVRPTAPSRPRTRVASAVEPQPATTATTTTASSPSEFPPPRRPWRRLGSFETLLARKAAAGPPRLSIPHVCVALVDANYAKLSLQTIKEALVALVRRHPKLGACIRGTNKVEGAPLAGVRRGGQDVDPYTWWPSPMSPEQIVDKALSFEKLNKNVELDDPYYFAGPFEAALDGTKMDTATGPLWYLKVLLHKEGSLALLFVFNHAISDQASANTMVHELLDMLNQGVPPQLAPQPFPPSIEEAVLGPARNTFGLTTIKYAVREGLLGALPITLQPHPSRQPPQAPSGLPAATRRTICEFRRLEADDLASLVQACKARGLTVTAALSAAMLYATSDFAHALGDESSVHNYRLLLSLNMRAFSLGKLGQATGGEDWADNAVASAAGAMDVLARVKAQSGTALRQSSSSSEEEDKREAFWAVAKQCRQELLDFVAAGYVPESVQLFDWGMQTLELNEVVEKEAENPKTLGRAYTCGVSNMGVFGPGGGKGDDSSSFSSSYGDYRLRGVHYATSHSLTGSLYQLSCGTVDGALCLTLHYAWPLVDRATAAAFADAVVDILRCVGERR